MRVTALSGLHSCYAAIAAFELFRAPAGRPAEQRIAGVALSVFSFGHFVRALTGPNILPGGTVNASLNGGWVGLIALSSALYIAVVALLIVRTVRRGGQSPDPVRSTSTGARSRQIR